MLHFYLFNFENFLDKSHVIATAESKVIIYSCIKVDNEFFGYQQLVRITNLLSNKSV